MGHNSYKMSKYQFDPYETKLRINELNILEKVSNQYILCLKRSSGHKKRSKIRT